MEPAIIIRTDRPEGNAFCIMATVRDVLRQLGRTKKEQDEAAERMRSGDYENLCVVAKEVTLGLVEVRGPDEDEEEDEDDY